MGAAGGAAAVAAAEAALSVLRAAAAPRDLLGAATVTVAAAAAFPAVQPHHLGRSIAAGLFPDAGPFPEADVNVSNDLFRPQHPYKRHELSGCFMFIVLCNSMHCLRSEDQLQSFPYSRSLTSLPSACTVACFRQDTAGRSTHRGCVRLVLGHGAELVTPLVCFLLCTLPTSLSLNLQPSRP